MTTPTANLSLSTLFRKARRISPQQLKTLLAGTIALLAVLASVIPAAATDQVIINGNGCTVTEEDAVGLLLSHDLYLRIDFPNTHWRFGLQNLGMKGTQARNITIQGAQYTSPQYIIKRAGLAEMFVPYDDRSETYYDMSFGDDRLDQIDQQDLPAEYGALVYFRNPARGTLFYTRDPIPKIGVECRDEGIGYLCKEPGSHVRRRIQEVVVWSVYDAFNYDYIIEYTFHEDGRITFRTGATGYNLPFNTSEAHVHNGLWRVSTKLLGRDDNQVVQFTHQEDGSGYRATDSFTPIPTEETADWNQLQFSSLLVESQTQTNDYGHLIGYEFYPYDRKGQGKFQETFTQHDQDLTNDNPGEDGTGTGTNNWLYTWFNPNNYLLAYLNNEPLGGTGDGIVLWYFGSTHHEPTDADNQMGSGARTGITLMHWLGFEMIPHNFFDYNPLGGPPRCGDDYDHNDARLLAHSHH